MAVHVLRFLRERAQAQFPGEPERVILTMPATWEAVNQALLRDVAVRAGYRAPTVLDLVPEPVAAMASAFGDLREGGAVHRSRLRPRRRHVRLRPGTPFQAQVRGARRPWRHRHDRRGRFRHRAAGPVAGPAWDGGHRSVRRADDQQEALADRWSLRHEAEQIKWMLSRAKVYQDRVTAAKAASVRITRAEFEELIRPLLKQTIAECERLLQNFRLTWKDVDRIVPPAAAAGFRLCRRCSPRPAAGRYCGVDNRAGGHRGSGRDSAQRSPSWASGRTTPSARPLHPLAPADIARPGTLVGRSPPGRTSGRSGRCPAKRRITGSAGAGGLVCGERHAGKTSAMRTVRHGHLAISQVAYGGGEDRYVWEFGRDRVIAAGLRR